MSSTPSPPPSSAHTPPRIHLLAHSLSDFLSSSQPLSASPSVALTPGDMRLLTQHALSHPRWADAPHDLAALLSFALCPADRPQPQLPALRAAAGPAATSGVCAKVWKQDVLAYKCKTCERDPTCVVCVQCFKLADHSGHDYAMVRTQGGCCDCGDVQAWRPDGFCSRHSGACAEDDDPARGIPQPLKLDLLDAVSVVAQHVLRLCLRNRTDVVRSPNAADVKRASVLLDWIADVVQCGDGIRRLVGVHLSSVTAEISSDGEAEGDDVAASGLQGVQDTSWLGVMLAIDGVDKLPFDIQESLHKVYFQLITDLVFKRSFLDKFVDNYERYIHAQVARKMKLPRRSMQDDRHPSGDIVENFTVQLFTVPALVPVMIRRGGLLDVLIDTLLNLFETCAAPVAPYDKSIPFAESAFANEYRVSREPVQASQHDPVASSSTSPLPTTRRKRHSLPLPFAARGPTRKRVLRRKRPSSGSQLGPNGEDLSRRTYDGFRGAVVASDAQTGSPVVPDPAAGTSPAHLERSLAGQPPRLRLRPNLISDAQGVEQHGEDGVRRPLPSPEAPEQYSEASDGNEDEDAMSIDADEGANIVDAPIDEDEDQMEEVHDPLAVEALANVQMIAAQLEEGGVDVEFPANVILHLQQEAQGGDEQQDGTEFAGSLVLVGQDAHLREQLTVFEDGLHFVPPTLARLVASTASDMLEANRQREFPFLAASAKPASLSPPSSPYLAAVKEARLMSDAAVLGTGPLAHTMRLEWPHLQRKMSEWVTWRVKYDLKYVLTHRAVAHHLVHVRKDLFRKFVRMISMAQGMNPSRRRFGDHVPIEADIWAKSFTIEIDLVYHYVELLADAFCGLGLRSGSQDASAHVADLASSRLSCIAAVRSCLDEWMEREDALEARSICTGESFSVAHSVSVHLPLHRFLAFMVHHVLRLDGIDLRTALSGGIGETTAEDARRLVKHPLRVQSFLAQIRAGMWRRNGRPVAGQGMLYRSVHYSEWFIDLDLFLQQCCAVIMGPDAYVRETLEAFRISDFSLVIRLPGSVPHDETHAEYDVLMQRVLEASDGDDGDESSMQASKGTDQKRHGEIRSAASLGLRSLAPRSDAPRGLFPPLSVKDTGNTLSELAGFIPTLVEDLLIHVVRVLSERSRCGSSESEFLRRKLVHQLCSRDRTHSELYKACSFRISMELDDSDNAGLNKGDKAHSLVESILPAVAEYVEPRGMEQGKYKLKDSLWEEFDSFAPHLSLRDRCAAEVRHAAACERRNSKMQVIPVDNINDRTIFPQLLDLHALSVVVSGERGLATELLSKVLPRNGGAQSVEGSIPPALHLVSAAAEMPSGSVSNGKPIYWLNNIRDEDGLFGTALGPVSEMYNISQRSESRLFQEYAPVLKRILNGVELRGNAVIQKFLSEKVSHSVVSPASTERLADSGSGPNQEKERRKIILRKKKEQQAAALAQMRLAQASFAKHIDDESPSGTVATGTAQTVDSSQRDSNIENVIISNEDVRRDNTFSAASDAALVAKTTDLQEAECALCHDVSRGDGTRLMGLIGFRQKTRLPAIAQEQCKRNKFYRGDEVLPAQSEDLHGTALPGLIRNGTGSISGDIDMQGTESQKDSALSNSELRESVFLNPQMLKGGMESGQNLHVSFCGHSIHIHCFDRYFSSLMRSRENQSMFEGANVLDLDKLEFLCPVCRRLANMVLPLMKDINARDPSEKSFMDTEVATSLCFSEWIERCGLEVNKGWSREASTLHIRSRLPSRKAEDMTLVRGDQKGEIASTVKALRLSIINNGKAVLQKFGLQSFRSSQTSNGAPSGDGDRDESMFNSYAKLPSAAISTVACAEIAARSGAWGGSVSQPAQRSLGIVLREARAQISWDPEPRDQGLKVLWKATESFEKAKEMDPFATFAFLLLLWTEPLNFYEARNLARLGFNLVQLQRAEDETNSAVTQIELDHAVLLYLRRACVLVSSFFEPLSDPPISEYDDDRNDADHDNVRREILRLMNYFDIPTPPDPHVSVGLKDMKALDLHSARLSFRPKRIGLIKLPKLFQSLLEELDGRKCAFCTRTPKFPALCLVCGDLLCSKAGTCGSNRLSLHAKECGAGIGVFLVLKITSVQIIREGRSSNWGSPYLDAHGEEDENLDRGKPLFLNMERYSSLERLWLTHGFDQDSRILSITRPTTRLITLGF